MSGNNPYTGLENQRWITNKTKKWRKTKFWLPTSIGTVTNEMSGNNPYTGLENQKLDHRQAKEMKDNQILITYEHRNCHQRNVR
jgi:hypothetical protein